MGVRIKPRPKGETQSCRKSACEQIAAFLSKINQSFTIETLHIRTGHWTLQDKYSTPRFSFSPHSQWSHWPQNGRFRRVRFPRDVSNGNSGMGLTAVRYKVGYQNHRLSGDLIKVVDFLSRRNVLYTYCVKKIIIQVNLPWNPFVVSNS